MPRKKKVADTGVLTNGDTSADKTVLVLSAQNKHPSQVSKQVHRGKKFTEDDALTLLESTEERYLLPENIRTICMRIAKQQYIDNHFKKDSLEWIHEQTVRIGILLNGCLEKGLITADQIDSLVKPKEAFDLLRVAMKLDAYKQILNSSAVKKRILQYGKEQNRWSELYEFRYRCFVPSTRTNPSIEYLERYQKAFVDFKFRMRFLEIVETNVPEQEKSNYFTVRKNKFGDGEIIFYSFPAIIGNLVLLAYFKDRAIEKSIDDFVELYQYCQTSFSELRIGFREVLHKMISEPRVADGVAELPNVVEQLDRIEEIVKRNGFAKFLNYFGADKDAAAVANKMQTTITDIGKWCYRREQVALADTAVDFVSPTLARAANNEFVGFIEHYPWFAKFLSRSEILRYLVAVGRDGRNELITDYMNPDRLIEAEHLLNQQTTIGTVLSILSASSSENEISDEIRNVMQELSRKGPVQVSEQRYERRAYAYINKLLTEWSDTAIIGAITTGQLPAYISDIFPKSYKLYLWYLYDNHLFTKIAGWSPPFEHPGGMYDYLKKEDVERYIYQRRRIDATNKAKAEAAQDSKSQKAKRSKDTDGTPDNTSETSAATHANVKVMYVTEDEDGLSFEDVIAEEEKSEPTMDLFNQEEDESGNLNEFPSG